MTTQTSTRTMRAFALDEFNAPGSVRDIPILQPGESEVVIDCRSS